VCDSERSGAVLMYH